MGRLLRALALGFALWSLAAPTSAAEPTALIARVAAQAGADAAGAADRWTSVGLAEAAGAMLLSPDVAFLLLILGAVGLIAEVYHPGAFFPGIVGTIALVVALVALGNLPTNWGAAGLLVFSLLLFLLEAHLPSHGVLGAGAVVAFLLGGLLLFASPGRAIDGGAPVAVHPGLLLAVGGGCAAFFLVVVRLGLRARRLPVADPLVRLSGAVGVTASALAPGGTVRVLNELWSAVSVGAPITAGERVEVVARDGLTLRVRRANPVLVRGSAALASQGEVRPGVRVERTG